MNFGIPFGASENLTCAAELMPLLPRRNHFCKEKEHNESLE